MNNSQTLTIKEYDFLHCNENKQNGYFLKPNVFKKLEKFILENQNDKDESITQYLKITTKKDFGKVLQAQNYVGIIQTKDGTTIEILPKIANLSFYENKNSINVLKCISGTSGTGSLPKCRTVMKAPFSRAGLTRNHAITRRYIESRNILIKMLKKLKNSPFKNINTANMNTAKMPLFEIFITMFLNELSLIVKKGLKNEYKFKQENLRFLKGKLQISNQIKHNHIHKERFFIAFDEFDMDNIPNRIIKTTLDFLYKKSCLNSNKIRIRKFLFIFERISISHNIKADFDKINKVDIGRQNKYYEQVLIWSKIFLLKNAFSPYKGDDKAYALLFDMNMLFEGYIRAYLKKHLAQEGLEIKEDYNKEYLAYSADNAKHFQLKPDMFIQKVCGKGQGDDNTQETIIADTKWKILNKKAQNQGISQADMYQLYAYGTKYEAKNIYLIYPLADNKTEETKYTYLRNNYKADENLTLQILFFDITKRFGDNKFAQKIL